MPGVGSSEGWPTIAKLLPTITVLPTKTRPKRLTFVGSDGQEYSYLLKAHEDLNLDERVAQLLALANLVLDSNHCKASNSRREGEGYACRTYAVIPLGEKCGLIRWVDGATPIYRLYQEWRVKEKAKNSSSATAPASTSTKATSIEQPVELFTAKLKRAFQARSLPKELAGSRELWPRECLEETLRELIADTPSDLLANALWLAADSPAKWWRKRRNFTRSCAAMSVLGAVIGLGDRHLENMLVDLKTGEVVHVDYNICFERGKRLRVPEVVPFRLTQNILGAMELAQGGGGTGAFRDACCQVLGALRGCKEVFRLLSDTFKRDPFVDWRLIGVGAEGAVVAAKRLEEQLGGGGSVEEQVDEWIRQATELSQLALMYEGWSAWV